MAINTTKMLENIKLEQRMLNQKIKDAEKLFREAKKLTTEFLAACGKRGIKRVAIGVSSKLVPRSTEFPFGASGSAFQYPENASTENGRVAIWAAAEEVGVHGVCGNHAKVQILVSKPLIEGVFELKNGDWIKRD